MADWNGFPNLDLSGVEEDKGIRRLDPGEHVVKCTEAKIEPVGDTNNRKLVADFSAEDGATIRHNFNVFHSNEQAMEIGLRQLKTFLVSANHPSPDKPGEVESMKGLKCKVYVGMGKPWRDRNGVERQNTEVKRFMPIEESTPQSASAEKKDFDDAIPF